MKNLTSTKALLSIFFFFLVHILFAQNIGNPPAWSWAQKFGGSGTDSGSDMVATTQGETYLTGTYNGTMKIGNTVLQSAGLNEAFVAKFGSDDALQWVKVFKANNPAGEVFGLHIALTSAGKVVVSGTFSQGNLVVGSNEYVRSGDIDLFFVQLDADGTVGWTQTYGISGSLSSNQLVADDQGNVYHMGIEHLMKIGPTGLVDWFQLVAGDYINNCLAYHNGVLYLAGNFAFSTEVGSQMLQVNNSAIFLCEVNTGTGSLSNARVVFEDDLPYITDSGVTDMLIKSPDEIYLVGRYRKTISSGSCSYSAPPTFRRAFIARINQTGCDWLSCQENETALTNEFVALDQDSDGNLWAGGSRLGPVQFGSAALGAAADGFVAKIDPATGVVSDLFDSPAFRQLILNGLLLQTTGNNNYSAYMNQMDFAGALVLNLKFESDGGYGLVASLESDQTGIYLTANVAGKAQVADLLLDVPESSMLIAKLNLGGDHVLWHQLIPGARAESRTWGNTGYLDKVNGKFYCLGSFSRDISFGGQTYPFSNSANLDYFIIQMNAAGNPGWLKPFVGFDYVNSLTTDVQGNLLVGGTFYNDLQLGAVTLTSKGEADFFIFKMDVAGNILWAQRGGGDDIEYSAILSTDAQNNIYMAAECYSLATDFNDAYVLNSNDQDGNVVLAKYDPNGVFQWAKLYGKSGTFSDEYRCFPVGLVADATGNTYLTGFSGRTNTIGAFSLASTYSLNNFAAKFDPSGDPVWATAIRTRRISFNYSEIDLDEAGDLYCMGQIADTVFFGNTPVVFQGAPLARNGYFAKLNGADGSIEWVRVQTGSPEAYHYPICMSVYDSKSILTGGYFTDISDFGTTTQNSASATNGFLALLGQEIMVDVQNPAPGLLRVSVYPNPATSVVRWEAPEALPAALSLSLLNSAGQAVLQRQIADFSQNGVIDVSGLPVGVYYLCFSSGNTREVRKVVVE